MNDLELYFKDLISKDKNKAQEAVSYLVNNGDVKLFEMLVAKSDYLFDFIRNNIYKYIESAVSKDNYLNILKFFDVYSVYYDDLFASILAKHATQDLTDEIFKMLEKGSESQKIYAAKYFSYIPDTVALELLSKYAFSDNELLSYNSAEALGQMQDDISFDIALSTLESDDDFEKLKAVKFFSAYGRNYPLDAIFKAMKTSKMPENIAGQIPYMDSLLNLLSSAYMSDTLIAIDNILSGFGEILPLSDIFQFELFEVLEFLININKVENINSSKIAEILLSAYSKFSMFCENQEYIFDESKDTKYEISSVLKLLQVQGEDFWKLQKNFVLNELKKSKDNIHSVLPVIVEYNLREAIPDLKLLLESDDETILCEVLTALNSLNSLDGINFDKIIAEIKNPNIKAVIENIKPKF